MRLGSDPEVFIKDPQTGKHLSIIGKVKAGKWDPLQIQGMAKGFTLQEDNVALEFGIPPASSKQQFVKNIQRVLKAGKAFLPGFEFSNLSCVVFDADQMKDRAAHTFGCEPDFNAWVDCPSGDERSINEKPVPSHKFMRSAGGHIHVETDKDPKLVARAMDWYLGLPSLILDDGSERRKLYGKAGSYRVKPYGLEYRTLSNFWVFDKKLIEWAWDQTEEAVKHANEFKDVYDLSWIRDIINENNKEAAMDCVTGFSIKLPEGNQYAC